jgi:hypothetical protein
MTIGVGTILYIATQYLLTRQISEAAYLEFLEDILGVERSRRMSEEEHKKAIEWLVMRADIAEVKQDGGN